MTPRRPDHPDVAFALVEIATDLLHLDRPREAIAPAQQAVELRASAEVDPRALDSARARLVQALWLGGRREQARRELARLYAEVNEGEREPPPWFEPWREGEGLEPSPALGP